MPAPTGRGLSRSPGDDFVVSRATSGEVVSLYSDSTWDLTPYEPRGIRTTLHFVARQDELKSRLRRNLVAEQKWLVYLVMWKKKGTPYGLYAVYHHHITIRLLAAYCVRRSITLSELFESRELILDAVVERKVRSFAKSVANLTSLLAGLGADVVGIAVPGSDLQNGLSERIRKYGEALAQHPPLPTRIYSYLLSTLNSELSEFEKVKHRAFDAIREIDRDPFVARALERQYFVARSLGVKCPKAELLDEFLVRHGLQDYFLERSASHSVRKYGLRRLFHILVGVQLALRLSIQAYSGMRAEEAGGLMVGCLREEIHEGQAHYVVRGHASKLNRGGQPRPAQWITSIEGMKAIRTAEEIALFIAKEAGIRPGKKSPIPIFLSVFYLPYFRPRGDIRSHVLVAQKLGLGNSDWLRDRCQPLITDEDVVELEEIDPHRAWRSEKRFAPGMPWVFTSHQLRRSLALYAQRSGLVSFPSLRRQLKHITEEMTRYYARGSEFAKQFIGSEKEHFGQEWQEAQPISSAISYIKNVLTTEDVLFGGHANWVNHRAPNKKGKANVDRDATIARFQNLEIGYRETPLGGCTKVGECDQALVKWLNVDCLKGCKNLVGRLPNLERVVEFQRRLVSRLDPSSLQFRMEVDDLETLVSTYEQVRLEVDSKSRVRE